MLKRVSIFELAAFAVLLWAVGDKLPSSVSFPLLVVAAFVFGRPVDFIVRETKPDGTVTYRWEWKDWLGLAVLLCAVVALAKGVSPVDLLRLLAGGREGT